MNINLKTSPSSPIVLLELMKINNAVLILEYLHELKKSDQFSKLSTEVNEEGNSFLHLAVLHYEFEDVKKFLEILDDAVYEMHLITNNEGCTAMQLVSQLTDKVKNKDLQDVLLETALEATSRCITDDSTPIDYQEIRTKFNVTEGSRLAHNLKKGCEAVNYCNEKKLKSNSHPRTNRIEETEFNLITEGIANLRKKNSQAVIPIETYLSNIEHDGYGNCSESTFLSSNFLYSQRTNYSFVSTHYNMRHHFVLMNTHEEMDKKNPSTYSPDTRLIYAGEYSSFADTCFFTRWLMNEMTPTVYWVSSKKQAPENLNTLVDCGKIKIEHSIESVSFKNGDHVFTILDRDLDSNIDQPDSYGEHAVIVDGWSNKVFPANKIENLMDYYYISINERNYSFLRQFNPKYHHFKISRTFNMPQSNITVSDSDANEQPEKSNDTQSESQPTQKAVKPYYVLENNHGLFKTFATDKALFDFAIKTYEDAVKMDVVYIAVKHNRASEIIELAKQGNDLNKVMFNGNTPTFIAALNGHAQVITELAQHGADVHKANNDGETPAFIAALNGYVPVINELAKYGADLNKPNDKGETPAFIAVLNGHVPVINELAKHGADLNKPNNRGETPAFIAAFNSYIPGIQELAKHRADLNKTNHNGETPAFIAALNGYAPVINELAKYGADLNKANNNGGTPAFNAVQKGHTAVVIELIRLGADFSLPYTASVNKLTRFAKNKSEAIFSRMQDYINQQLLFTSEQQMISMTAYDIALIMGQEDIIQLLKHGADAITVVEPISPFVIEAKASRTTELCFFSTDPPKNSLAISEDKAAQDALCDNTKGC